MTTQLFNVSDTYVSSKYSSKNYAGSPVINVRQASGDAIYGQLLTPMIPQFPSAVISSYKLQLTPQTSFTSTTFNVRLMSAKWASTTSTWANRPAVGSIIATVTTAGTAGVPIDFVLTASAQSWLAGASNFGIRIETTSTAAAGRVFHSANASGASLKYRPVVLIDWAAPPAVPSGFVATGGSQVSVSQPTLPWAYSDPAGLPMVAYRYQSNVSNSWSSPTTDTGEVSATSPQHTLTGTLTDGQQFYYRVQHKNAAGLWSAWSDGQLTGRTSKPALNITSPSGSVTDYTPTYTFALGSGTLTGFRAITTRDGVLLDDSKDRGPDTQYAPPKPLAVEIGDSVTLTLRARDAVDRVDTPGDPSYIEQSVAFTMATATGIDPVTDLDVAQADVGPMARVSWSRATTPDSYAIERRVAAFEGDAAGPWRPFDVAPGDVALTSTTNAWFDTTAPPLVPLEYRVRPVVNGQMGGDNTIAACDPIQPGYIWLLDPEDPEWVLPAAGNDQGTLELGEQSAVVEVRGSDRAHLVHEAVRGFEGSVTGLLVSGLPNVGGLTARQIRDRAWRTKSEPLKLWRLVIGDMNIPVYVYRVNPAPRPGAELTFGLSFSFLQQGELWWAA